MSLFDENQWLWLIVLITAMGLAMRTIIRRLSHRRAQRLGLASTKPVTHVSNTANELRRADGTLASATLTFGNGNVYTGELNGAQLFHGVGAYQYKVTRGSLAQYTPAQLAARRKALVRIFHSHRNSNAQCVTQLQRLFAHPLWESIDELSLNASVAFVGYAGQFKEGFQHGVGREFTENDQAYEGQFRDGKRHGFGILVYAGGDQGVYVGQFLNDKKFDDAGTFIFGPKIDPPTVLPQFALNSCVFVGPFRNGLRHGRGTLRKPDGTEIVIEFEQGKVVSNQTVALQTPSAPQPAN